MNKTLSLEQMEMIRGGGDAAAQPTNDQTGVAQSSTTSNNYGLGSTRETETKRK